MVVDDTDNRSMGPTLSNGAALVALAVLALGAGMARSLVEAIEPSTLVPWVGVSALAIGWTFRRPAAVDLFSPFVFLSWTHYAPAYVVGAFLLAIGVVEYPYRFLVADPIASCALALLYTVLGYLAVGVGCQWQAARALGARLTRVLPAPPTSPTIPMGAILLLVALGGGATYAAFRVGIVGFAIPRTPGPLDAAASYATALLSLGHFLFWFRWFDRRQERPSRVALLIPALIVLFVMTISGSRGALLSSYLVAALAYRFAKGRLSVPQGVVVVTLAFVTLSVGMVYGTLFRMIKGGETGAPVAAEAPVATEGPAAVPATGSTPPGSPTSPGAAEIPVPAVPEVSRPSLARQIEVATATTVALARDPWTDRALSILSAAGQRLNLLSDASVGVARYRDLRPLEAEHGVADLWTMTWTGLVPRVLWPGKPMVGNARAYSALYFGYDGNSYAWTPQVDLIRNLGPFLMPLGMALLGTLLGAMSTALIGTGPNVVPERAALFSLLLVHVNLEGSYGLLIPTMLRIGLVVLFGLTVARLWSLRRR